MLNLSEKFQTLAQVHGAQSPFWDKIRTSGETENIPAMFIRVRIGPHPQPLWAITHPPIPRLYNLFLYYSRIYSHVFVLPYFPTQVLCMPTYFLISPCLLLPSPIPSRTIP